MNGSGQKFVKALAAQLRGHSFIYTYKGVRRSRENFSSINGGIV